MELPGDDHIGWDLLLAAVLGDAPVHDEVGAAAEAPPADLPQPEADPAPVETLVLPESQLPAVRAG